jgi:hypothetical protein
MVGRSGFLGMSQTTDAATQSDIEDFSLSATEV